MRGSKAEICVVGAGVVGLSTALSIQQNVPSAKVTVLADKFLSDTLSFGAGGFFRPEENIGPDKDSIRKWAQVGYDQYSKLAIHEHSSGNHFVSGYQLSSHSEDSLRNELVESIVSSSVRKLNQRELATLFPDKFQYGIFWTTIITDPRYYLPYLHEKISQNGGILCNRHIDSFDELTQIGHYDVIVNCSGLQASKLCHDHRIVPVRGQAFKVRAPWIRHFYFADGAYILPGRDYVTLGGIKDYGNSNMSVSELDRVSIWKRCTELVPSLHQAEVAFEWVGLRPQRQPVRVEYERMQLAKGAYDVVHNYGHGGHGVTLSWGTAQDSAALVYNCLTKSKL